jgi:hypothetical protein
MSPPAASTKPPPRSSRAGDQTLKSRTMFLYRDNRRLRPALDVGHCGSVCRPGRSAPIRRMPIFLYDKHPTGFPHFSLGMGFIARIEHPLDATAGGLSSGHPRWTWGRPLRTDLTTGGTSLLREAGEVSRAARRRGPVQELGTCVAAESRKATSQLLAGHGVHRSESVRRWISSGAASGTERCPLRHTADAARHLPLSAIAKRLSRLRGGGWVPTVGSVLTYPAGGGGGAATVTTRPPGKVTRACHFVHCAR